MNIHTCGCVLCLVVLVCGCQQSQPMSDPFLGRTTVPPPGTGQAGQVVMPNPYDASAPSFVPPAVGAPPAGAPPTTYAPAVPPGYQGYQPPAATAPAYRQGQWRPSNRLSAVEASAADDITGAQRSITNAESDVAPAQTTDADNSVTAQNAADDQDEDEDENMARTADAGGPVVQTASFRDPRGLDELASGQLATPAAAAQDVDTIGTIDTVEPYDLDAALAAEQPFSWTDSDEIQAQRDDDIAAGEVYKESPDADDTITERQYTQRWQAAPSQPPEVKSADAGQLASWTSPAAQHATGTGASVHFASTSSSTSSSTTARSPAVNATYGHDREYRRLQGVLEHSRISGRWKLRYTPIDGETDNYGGSVQLRASDTLEDYQHGEAVTIEGHIEAADVEGGVFAPKYLIESIRRQGA